VPFVLLVATKKKSEVPLYMFWSLKGNQHSGFKICTHCKD
jgi:hypothetical protein